MGDVTVCQAFDFPLVRLLQRGKTPNVKQLEDVRGVRRHIEGNNLAFLAEILEFKRLVALVAVNNQQLIASYSSSLYILNKVLKLGKTKLIYSLAVVANPNLLVFQVVNVLGLIIVLCLKDKEGWDRLAYYINTSNQSYLLTIARLDAKQCTTSFRRSYCLN